MRSIYLSASFLFISLWWIFLLLWQPQFIQLISEISYIVEKPIITKDEITETRKRALLYATEGTTVSQDLLFSKEEVSHLIDVYHIYRIIAICINVLSIISWSLLLIAIIRKIPLQQSLALASKILLYIAMLGTIAALFFTPFFIAFHRLLFPQGNWQFSTSSYLIQTFPESFWKLMVLMIVTFVLVFAGIYKILSISKNEE